MLLRADLSPMQTDPMTAEEWAAQTAWSETLRRHTARREALAASKPAPELPVRKRTPVPRTNGGREAPDSGHTASEGVGAP